MNEPFVPNETDIQGLLEVKWLEGYPWDDEEHSTTKRTLGRLIRRGLVSREMAVSAEISYRLTDDGWKMANEYEVRHGCRIHGREA